MAERAAPEIAAVSKSEPAERRAARSTLPSLRHEPRSLFELFALLLVAYAAATLGGAVDEPLHDIGCDGVIAFELARPSSPPTTIVDDTAVEGVTPVAAPTGERGLRTIDGVVADCGRDYATVSRALHDSTRADFPFIALYVVGLGWCCARAAGWCPGGLVRVESSPGSRTVARVAMWFTVAAGLCDVVENTLLLRTADRLQDPETRVVAATGAAAGAKFLLIVLPIAITLWVLVRLLLRALPAGLVPVSLGDGIGPARLRVAYEQLGGVEVDPTPRPQEPAPAPPDERGLAPEADA